MSLISRKPRPLDRASKDKDARLFVIATEGARTEPRYFKFQVFQSTRIQVEVLPTDDGCSAPKHVLKRLRDYAEKYDLAADDELWLVLDVDKWTRVHLSEVCDAALVDSFKIAVSNPCFEVWLLLHFVDHLPDSAPKKELYELLSRVAPRGYKKTNPKNPREEDFAPHIDLAIERARALDVNPDERWPSTTGTRVYRLVEKLKTFLDSPANG